MKTIIATFFVISIFITSSVQAQSCQISFTSHTNGSVVTSYPEQLAGTAVIPIGGHLWLLSHLIGFDGWWPQGNSQRVLSGNQWICAVFLGKPGELGKFEVSAVIVNDQENAALMSWVSTAQDKGYPPIPFPNALQRCNSVTIAVTKQ